MKKLLAILLLGITFAGQITERIYMTPTANGRYQSATWQLIGTGNVISVNNSEGLTVKTGSGVMNVQGTISGSALQVNGQPKSLVRLASAITLVANSEKLITFDTEISDVQDMYVLGTFTATSNGTYLFTYNTCMIGAIGSNFYHYIYKNGSKITYQTYIHVANVKLNGSNSWVFILNKGDTIQLKIECSQAEQIEGNVTAQLYSTYANFVKLY